MRDANQMCVLCNEVITNPICLDCLGNAMQQWAEITKPGLEKKIKEKLELFNSYTHKVTTCVVCGKNINICAHCLSNKIFKWLERNHPETTESFLISFNYQLKVPCRF